MSRFKCRFLSMVVGPLLIAAAVPTMPSAPAQEEAQPVRLAIVPAEGDRAPSGESYLKGIP